MEVNQNVTAMQWRAPLVRLTCIGNPDVNGGEPTTTYVAAEQVGQIRRLKAGYRTYASMSEEGAKPQFHPGVECTEVNCCHFILLVTETPEMVAALRDRAFGFAAEPAGTVTMIK